MKNDLFQHIKRASAIITLMLLLFSCATYNNRIQNYYGQMANSNYKKADAALDNISLLKKDRNKLLYLLEKGKMAHLLQQYDSSNQYFNAADSFMEDTRTSLKDVALGTLLNPMMQTYRGEDFEKFMVHYYKALNYIYLGQPDEAMVEARRITLQSYAQQDKAGNSNKYSNDAFSLILQGVIYEQSGDINNAFISYRNAADIYLKNKNTYYGVVTPAQLKYDVVRTAIANGFDDEAERYQQLFNFNYKEEKPWEGGELVLFWENGLAPVKVLQDFYFALVKDGLGNFGFVDPSGAFNIPFDFSTGARREDLKLSELRSIHVAFPKYVEQPMYYSGATLAGNDETFGFEPAQDINALAFATLRERFLKEMGITLSRVALKKLAEAAARPKSDDKHKDEKEALALAIQIFNFASEKADTRNWQSLPHTIYYTRIPLLRGKNRFSLNLETTAGQGRSLVIEVEGTGRLQVRNVSTLR